MALSVANPSDFSTTWNTGDLASLLKGTDRPLPERFIYPEREGAASCEATLPTFDLSLLECGEEKKKLLPLVAEACAEWGFFQVVGHGVPKELLAEVMEAGYGFFSLPSHLKEKAAFGRTQGYEGTFAEHKSRAPWLEALTFTASSSAEHVASKVWPEHGNPAFCNAINTVNRSFVDLTRRITIILAESLGLGHDTFSCHFLSKKQSVRFNYYPPCPQPEMAYGVPAHTDPNCITILFQDEVGGLEIRAKDDTWVAVKPQSEALVINIGDSLEVWTNRKFRSVQHRVVLKKTQGRLSFGMFLVPNEVTVIEPPAHLIDKAHPPQFKPVTWEDYIDFMKAALMKGEPRPSFKDFASM